MKALNVWRFEEGPRLRLVAVLIRPAIGCTASEGEH